MSVLLQLLRKCTVVGHRFSTIAHDALVIEPEVACWTAFRLLVVEAIVFESRDLKLLGDIFSPTIVPVYSIGVC